MVKNFFFVLQEVAVSTLEYLTDLLYNGFYCFEAFSTRNLDDGISGICGVVGEVYLGDGNEKNCCSRKEVNVFSCCELFKLMLVINFFWLVTIYFCYSNTVGWIMFILNIMSSSLDKNTVSKKLPNL